MTAFFFDANSFSEAGQEIIVNRDNVFCASMDWSGVQFEPTLSGNSKVTININGGLKLIDNIIFDFEGSFYFSGSGSNMIDFRNYEIRSDLTVNGEDDSDFMLVSPLIVKGTFRHQGGDFSSNALNLICSQINIDPKNNIQFDISNSEIEITSGEGYTNPSLFVNTSNLELIDDNSSVIFSAIDAYVTVTGNNTLNLNKVDFTHVNGCAYFQGDVMLRSRASVKINKLSFASNAEVFGMNEFNELIMTPGKSYILESGSTQVIDRIQGIGTCSRPITIFSSASGQEATIEFKNNNTLEYINIQDIHATSNGTPPSINQATTGGNVLGWNLELRSANTLYWIGGAGNWSDPAHWSFSSGGAGGACVPTFLDDVVFDQNSFRAPGEAVTIDAQDIYFKTMEWRNVDGTPQLVGENSQRINVHGSIYLQPDMVWDFKGDIHFKAVEETHYINTANHLLIQDVHFEGFKAIWYLESELNVNRNINFLSSTLYTQSYRIECELFQSAGSRARAIYLEDSYVMVRSNRNFLVTWTMDNTNLFFDAGTSTIELTSNLGVFNNSGNGSNGSIDYATVIFSSDKSSSISHDDFTTKIKRALYKSNSTVRGNHHYLYAELFKGNNYTFGAKGEVFLFDSLVANGDCTDPISIVSQSQIDQAQFVSDNHIELHYTTLEGIQATGSGSFISYSGVDLGNNSGWFFEDVPARTLYWVGVNNDWHDPQNWANSSDGAGGECLPTPSDDVIFDDNSFPMTGGVVFSSKDKIGTCNNFYWNVSDTSASLRLEDLHCFGSFEIFSTLNLDLKNIVLRGGEVHNLSLHSGIAKNLELNTTGSYVCTGPIQAVNLEIISGTLITMGNPITAEYFDIQGRVDFCKLDCSGSNIRLKGKGSTSKGSFSIYGDNVELITDGSNFEFIHPEAKLYVHGKLKFDRVNFLDRNGRASIQSNVQSRLPKPIIEIKYLRFGGGGEIYGGHQIDSLIFTAGKGYILESGVTQTIEDYWLMLGNNCSQIKLSASEPGVKSIVHMESGSITSNFVQMQDQQASGNAIFNAGRNSTNVNDSNIGWSFVETEDDINYGILGADQVLCRNESVELNNQRTIAAEKYRWNNGTDGETMNVNESGKYWLKATFAQNCEIVDTIEIEVHNDLKPELGEDTTICNGQNIIIETQYVSRAEYRWNNGAEGYSIEANEQGDYILTATKDHCVEADTIKVILLDPEGDILPAAIEACQNSAVELKIHAPDAEVIWNTGSTDTVIQVKQEGIYWATIVKSGCKIVDSTVVDFIEGPVTDLPDTVRTCSDERVILEVTLRVPIGGIFAEYTRPFLDSLVEETEMFYYLITDPKCPTVDSVLIEVDEVPYLYVDSVIQICSSQNAVVLADTDAEEIFWSNGDVGPTTEITEPGTYQIIASNNGCISESEFLVEQIASQSFDLFRDTSICMGSEFELSITNPDLHEFRWNDGSTEPEFRIYHEGVYWIDFKDANQCEYRDSIVVEEHICEEIEVFIPNIFSPNGDGNNDVLKSFIGSNYPILKFTMQVYDRWGNQIFNSTDPDQGWDGRSDGQLVANQVYVCIVQLTYQHPEGIREDHFSSDVLVNP